MLNDEDLGSVPETWRPRGERHCVRRPSPGASCLRKIDTGEGNRLGTCWNHSGPPVVLSGGGTRDLPAAGPRRARQASAANHEALKRGAAEQQVAPHDVVAPVALPPPHRRPHLPASERRGQRAATPPAAIGSPARGTVRHPLGGLFLGPVCERYTPWKCRHPAESSEGAGPENSSAPHSAGCSSTRFRESAPQKTCVPRKTLDAVGPGTVRATPSAGCSFRLGLDVEFPHLPSSGSHAPDQVPDSVTDIDRPAAGADHPRGHDAPLLLVDLSSTPAVGVSVPPSLQCTGRGPI